MTIRPLDPFSEVVDENRRWKPDWYSWLLGLDANIQASGLSLSDTDASHFLSITLGSDLTDNRTLTIFTGDADRTLTLSGNATISGTNTGDQTITLTGDVIGSGTGSFAATIQNDTVTFAKMQNIATDKLIGRVSASTGDPEEVTCTDFAQGLLDDVDASAARTTLGLGTAAVFDVGTGANNIVQLDGTPKLPAVDGSALTNLPAPQASQGGSLVLISSQVASNSTTIDFTGLTNTYEAYEVWLTNVKPATDQVELRMRVGTGAGPTYQADATDYYWQTQTMSGAVSAINGDTADNEMVLTFTASANALGNAAGENLTGTVKFGNPAASDFHAFAWMGTYRDSANVPRPFWGGGGYEVAEPITAIRFLMSSGNIASGRFSLYGYKKA